MKAIQLLVNSQLPPDLRDYSRSMDAKSISNLMADVARKYPEQYERISKSVSDIGRNAAYIQGETLTLNDNKPVIDLHAILKEMDDEVDAARKSTPDKDEFENKRNTIWEKFNERIDKDTSSAALAKGNNLAYSVVSGARGKSQQLKMMISTPGLYTDAQDDLVPIFVRNSFGEGLRPAEYLASTYGARKSVLCLHEDTLVRKPDGSSVAIKDIQVDDVVMGADIQSNKMPVAVVAVYKQGRQPVNKYIFRKAGSNAVRSVTCTENHKFLATTVNGVEVLPIKDIIYSNVLLLDGAVWRLTDVEEIGLKYCYDIEVDNEDHLFVLESGIIVSNSTKRATAKGGDLCLVKGTSVRMADGTEKNIEDIIIGDMVLGCSTAGVATPVDVVNTFYQGHKQTYDVGFPIGKGSRKYGVIGCTLNHKFLCSYSGNKSGAFITSLNARARRDMLVRSDTSLARIASIVDTGYRECYDIEVDHPDHLFVLANGIVTSNSKQLTQSAAHIVVSENDCGVGNGIALDMDDRSVRGRVLAREVGGLPAGTALDRDAMAALRRKGVSKVIARSAMTCQSKEGVCSKCLGLNALGKFPMRGESVGITAANSIGEPICLYENTLVRMADWTTKKIKDILPGDMVLGSDINAHITPVKVVNVFHNGIRPGYRTVVKKGKGQGSELIELLSTKEHKVLSYQGRVASEAIPTIQPIEQHHKKHWVYLSKGTGLSGDGVDEPLAALLGILTGDGSYTGGKNGTTMHGVFLSCYDKQLEDYVRSFLDTIGVTLRAMASGEFRLSMKDQYNNFDYVDGVLIRNTIKARLMREGMWGQNSGTKTLPASIQTWNNKSIAAYIGGIIATDGWITSSTDVNSVVVGMASNSEQLLTGVKTLLENRFGIYCSCITGKVKKKEGGGVYATTYNLTVSDTCNIRALHKFIPIPGCKQSKLNAATQNLADKEYTRGRYCVISQEPIGDIDTWDIEVDNDTHLFVLANNMVVSNTQGALNTKHTGGAAGANRRFAGFPVINQFVQSPEVFPDKAVVSTIDGTVSSIMDAPQGGFYVTVNNEPHYVPPGYPAIVKVGDKVEAGDIMTQGLPDPGDVVDYKGLGAGRKYYADKLKELLDDSGMEADRRNTELMARAALDHVQITGVPDDESGYIPDDVISYSSLSNTYVPPTNTAKGPTKKFIGSYLQAPALHYTIGTKITPKLAKELDDLGYGDVYASPTEPVFKAIMPRLRSAAHNNTDWLASMHTSYLKKQISESAIRGEDTNIESNTHFAPRLAIGANFGDNITQTGKF